MAPIKTLNTIRDETSYKDWYRDENGKLKFDSTGKLKLKKKSYPTTKRRTYSEEEKTGLLDAVHRFHTYYKARAWFKSEGYGELKESVWDLAIATWKQYGKEGLEYMIEGHSVSDVKREMRKRLAAKMKSKTI